MPTEPVNYSQIFSLIELISAPLLGTVQADFYAAEQFVRYLREYGFEPSPPGENPVTDWGNLRMITFQYQTAQGWSEIQLPIISIIPLPFLQVSDADYRYNIKVLGMLSPQGATSRDPALWTSGTSTGAPISTPNHIMASFAPLRPQGGAVTDQTPTLVANMDIGIRMRQGDMPAGIATLLNLAQTAVEGQIRNRISLAPAVGTFGPATMSVVFTAQVLDRRGRPAPNQTVSFTITSTEPLSFLNPLMVVQGTLVDQQGPHAINVLSDDTGRAGVEVRCRKLPPQRVDAYLTAEAEMNMGSGQFAAESAKSLVQIFPSTVLPRGEK